MRKLILSFALLLSAIFSLSAQQVCFWTNEYKTLPIRIYVDEKYVGDITASFDKAPEYGAEGTLCVDMTPGTHKVAAVNAYGYEYDDWPGTIRPDEDRVNFVKLRRDRFPHYTSWDYIIFDPYWYGLDYGPYYYYHGHHPGSYHSGHASHSDSLDEGDLNEDYTVGLIVTAASLFVTGMVGAIMNWNYPDYRFPYFSAGLKTEYLPGANALRNVAKFKGRIGNYGGMSFIAEGGEACYFDENLWEPTIAAGFGWAYGAFEVDFRYQLPVLSTHQLASLDFSYDWFVAKHLAIDFNLGLALSGTNTDTGITWNRWNGVEIPFGLGLQYVF
ncbi:MAG: hypothetical protein IKS71_07465 [Bacteroidales bacterium]|nr:hypothetical protein [Bacteroidales bacterium]